MGGVLYRISHQYLFADTEKTVRAPTKSFSSWLCLKDLILLRVCLCTIRWKLPIKGFLIPITYQIPSQVLSSLSILMQKWVDISMEVSSSHAHILFQCMCCHVWYRLNHPWSFVHIYYHLMFPPGIPQQINLINMAKECLTFINSLDSLKNCAGHSGSRL